ncbi:MAG: AsmA family protein [Krumholzibacteria bacterium]|nr:AsmA family protein [Candidatus Krumholzibacteria bacterium]
MRIPRVLRRLGVLVGVVAALLIVLAAVVPMLVSADAVRDRLLPQAEAATGARIALDEAQLVILPRLGLKLRSGRIEGTGQGLREARGRDWGIESYLLEIDEVEVGAALWPLLSRRLEVRQVRLSGPQLRLVRDGRVTVAQDYRLVLRDLALGPAAAPVPGAPPGDAIPADLACRADLAIGRLAHGDVVYDDVTAEAALEDRVLEVPRFAARLGGGALSGSAAVDWARDPWGELVFAWEAAGVPAADLLGPWVPELARRLEGTLDASGRGSCSLRDRDAALASLDLAGTASAGAGVLHAADWLRDVSPYLGNRQDLKDIRFTELGHAFGVERGRYVIEDLAIDGPDTRWRGAGSVGLDGSLDLALQVTLPPGFTPDLGQWSFLAETLRDRDGRVQLDLVLGGRAERPSVGLDLSRLKAGMSDQGAETIKEGVGSLLDKWKSK